MGSNLRILSYIVILYMIFALIWWAILLYRKNNDVFKAQKELIELKGEQTNISPQIQKLKKNYARQNQMIFGETFVFVLSLTIGVWLINRSHKKEMTAATQSKNFLLSITHELKSPLASIQLILETFQKRSLPADKIKFLSDGGLKETSRLNQLVDNLLLSAKLDSSYQLFLEKFSLHDLITDTISDFKELHAGVDILFSPHPIESDLIADKNALSIIIRNILENSFKYSPEPAKIIIETKFTPPLIILQITDTGFGISDSEKDNVFNPFYRIGNEDTRKTKGTGLGLFIVKKLVEAHHGKVSILDNPKGGTILKIILPYLKKDSIS
jgi:signal transduction histidine kinase